MSKVYKMWQSNRNLKTRKKTIAYSNNKATEPPSQPPEQPPESEDTEQENSLLNKNNKIKGNVVSLNNYQVNYTQPISGVYCIFCTVTGKHYVGEAINLKDRLKEHHDQLNNGTAPNSKLLSDFNKYGASSFELILHNTSDAMVDFQTRLKLQNDLQSTLNRLNLCYNTGLSETVNPRSQGQWPSQPGICLIYCEPTNTYYMCGTIQKGGIKGRLQSLRNALRRGKCANSALQNDWSVYGEEAFNFLPYDFGNSFGRMSPEEIKNYTQEQIKTLISGGYRFYNKINSSLKSSLVTQSPLTPSISGEKSNIILPTIQPVSSFQANVDYYNPPQGSDAKKLPINMANRVCLVADKNTYLSIVEASNCLGVHQNVVKTRLDDGKYRKATREEIMLELLRRNWSTNKDLAVVNLPKTPSKRGVPVLVEVKGVIYPTLVAAGKAENISPNSIKKRIKNNKPGHRYLTPEEAEEWQRNV